MSDIELFACPGCGLTVEDGECPNAGLCDDEVNGISADYFDRSKMPEGGRWSDNDNRWYPAMAGRMRQPAELPQWIASIRMGLYGGPPYMASGIFALNALVAWLNESCEGLD